jgi:hypothetical protein
MSPMSSPSLDKRMPKGEAANRCCVSVASIFDVAVGISRYDRISTRSTSGLRLSEDLQRIGVSGKPGVTLSLLLAFRFFCQPPSASFHLACGRVGLRLLRLAQVSLQLSRAPPPAQSPSYSARILNTETGSNRVPASCRSGIDPIVHLNLLP